jgi:hypothetical protein
VILAAVVAVLLGCGAALTQMSTSAGAGAFGDLPRSVAQVAAAQVDAEAPPPRGVTIERLGIESDLIGLRMGADGALAVPQDPGQVGWHRAGTAPGDIGPAVLVGHVDSYEGPAVFFRLAELQPGDRVSVARTDGSAVAFEVYALETVPKNGFPSDRVYGPTEGPELRLITCGGGFDRETRSYTDNVVVYARAVADAA